MSRAGSVLHLSEHHGDATPGSAVRIEVDDLDVPDPFGNRLVFHTPGAAVQ